MKNWIKYILQKLLGYERYLFVFSKFKIKRLEHDIHEKDFFIFLNHLEDGKGDVLDIGANLGLMSYHLSKKLSQQTVHAFEPIPDNYRTLQKIIAHFQLTNIHTYPIALGEEEGEIEMIVPLNEGTKMQGLSHVKHESITEWNQGTTYTVPIQSLDQIQFENHIQGIKLDVENFEYFVLKGGKQLISTQKPLIYIELWENENRKQCFEFLLGMGYQAMVVEGNELVPYQEDLHATQNFIFQSNLN